MDVAAIEPGRDFRKAIDQSVSTCSVLLAIVGLEWLETKDAQGRRRLDDSDDFVRIELASALRRDIPVIPVLVRGARMPTAAQLPDDLKELAYRNAVELTHARWKSDVQVLVQALRAHIDERPAASRTADSAKPSAREAAKPSTPPTSFDPQLLERISRELASSIGPIADVVVRRAAKRCSSVLELCETVAHEIEGDAARARFLKACRSLES